MKVREVNIVNFICDSTNKSKKFFKNACISFGNGLYFRKRKRLRNKQ